MSQPTAMRVTPLAGLALTSCVAVALLLASSDAAHAAATPVDLGAASSFAVLGYSTVTNTGATTISGDIGLNSGSSVTGFPPGTQVAGGTYVADALSLQARTDATSAFSSASGQPGPTAVPVELGGEVLTPDLYESGDVFTITGDLTLDGQGDPDAVFIFRSTATLITASASNVVLINNANPCNVFWILPSSATLGTGSTMVGTVIASDTIDAETGSSVTGRLLALNGAVNLDTTTVTSTGCAAVAVVAGPALPVTGIDPTPALAVGFAAIAASLMLFGFRRRVTGSN